MISRTTATLALRARAIDTVVATTGAVQLTATTTGYSRADGGSFLDDNFHAGQELTPTLFTSNPVDIITSVTATTITTKNARAAQAVGTRTLTVSLPAARAWENERFAKPSPIKPYVEESFVPATSQTITLPANGGQVQQTGLYVLRVYGLSGYGLAGLNSYVDALLLQFAPGTALTIGSDVLHVRTDTSVNAGQIIPLDNGWSVVTITIPWLARSLNQVAA